MLFDYDLTVVITTCDRHELFRRCLDAIPENPELSIQTIVVDESDEKVPMSWLTKVDIVLHKNKRGMWGSYAKDDGLEVAAGEFVCFWDDDNLYHQDALLTLYRAARGHDIGVVKTTLMGSEGNYDIPAHWNRSIVHGDIDTMCLCVRTNLAKKHKWVDGNSKRNTDFRWIGRVCQDTNDINFINKTIGELIPWKGSI